MAVQKSLETYWIHHVYTYIYIYIYIYVIIIIIIIIIDKKEMIAI